MVYSPSSFEWNEQTEDLLSLHIILQFLRLILLWYLRIFSLISPESLCGLCMNSKVVLFLRRFLIWWIKSSRTGTTNIDEKMHIPNKIPKRILLVKLSTRKCSKNHSSYLAGSSRTMQIYPRTEARPTEPRLRMRKNKKKINLPMFFFPTQLLIQVQWWSYCWTQTLQISQW